MGRTPAKGEKTVETLVRFYLRMRSVYKRNKRYVKVKLSWDEAETLLDALESWVEGSQGEAWSADEDVLNGLFGSMSDAITIRSKLWKKMRGR